MTDFGENTRPSPHSSRQVVWQGRHLNMAVRGRWEFAERRAISGIVGIVAVTDDGKLLLTEQYRPPVDARVIELPAGLAGDAPGREGESLETAARRELLEETGYEARRLRRLCRGTSSAGICDEVVTLFLATGLEKRGQGGGDDAEVILVHEVPVDGIEPWLQEQEKRGVVVDLKVHAALRFCHSAAPPDGGEEHGDTD